MNYLKNLTFLAFVLVVVIGCYRDEMSERGFRLPVGDAANGRAAFVYMQCTQCHTVRGDSFLVEAPVNDPYVVIGGSVSKVKTYGQLVTSIINPSHELAKGYPEDLVAEDGESNMYVYNSYMTVQELIDLVTYLQPFYDVIPPHYRVGPGP